MLLDEHASRILWLTGWGPQGRVSLSGSSQGAAFPHGSAALSPPSFHFCFRSGWCSRYPHVFSCFSQGRVSPPCGLPPLLVVTHYFHTLLFHTLMITCLLVVAAETLLGQGLPDPCLQGRGLRQNRAAGCLLEMNELCEFVHQILTAKTREESVKLWRLSIPQLPQRTF